MIRFTGLLAQQYVYSRMSKLSVGL